MPRYNVGDKVMVRHDLSRTQNLPFGISREMEKMAGKIVTIRSVYEEHYWRGNSYTMYRINGDAWDWHESMFIPSNINRDNAFEMLVNKQISSIEYEKIINS